MWIQIDWPKHFLPIYSNKNRDGTFCTYLWDLREDLPKKPQNVSAVWRFYDRIFFWKKSLLCKQFKKQCLAQRCKRFLDFMQKKLRGMLAVFLRARMALFFFKSSSYNFIMFPVLAIMIFCVAFGELHLTTFSYHEPCMISRYACLIAQAWMAKVSSALS